MYLFRCVDAGTAPFPHQTWGITQSSTRKRPPRRALGLGEIRSRDRDRGDRDRDDSGENDGDGDRDRDDVGGLSLFCSPPAVPRRVLRRVMRRSTRRHGDLLHLRANI